MCKRRKKRHKAGHGDEQEKLVQFAWNTEYKEKKVEKQQKRIPIHHPTV